MPRATAPGSRRLALHYSRGCAQYTNHRLRRPSSGSWTCWYTKHFFLLLLLRKDVKERKRKARSIIMSWRRSKKKYKTCGAPFAAWLPQKRLLRPRKSQRRGVVWLVAIILFYKWKRRKKICVYSTSKRRGQSSMESNTYDHFSSPANHAARKCGAIHTFLR